MMEIEFLSEKIRVPSCINEGRPLLTIIHKSLHKEEQYNTSILIFRRKISVHFQTYEDTTSSFLVRAQQKMSPVKNHPLSNSNASEQLFQKKSLSHE